MAFTLKRKDSFSLFSHIIFLRRQKPVVEEQPVADVVQLPAVEKATVTSEVLTQLASISNFYDLQKVMTPLKDAGKISSFGKYSTMTDPEDCYLIVYDQQANIKAVLGKGSSVRPNLKTQKDDSEKNYHGCGAIWFKINE